MRVVVVGASSGIGRETAKRLVQTGASVVFCARRGERLREAVAEAGGGHAVVADISVDDGCASLVAEAAAHLGSIDLLVVAASSSRLTRLKDTTGEEWAAVLRSNVIGPSLVVREALPHMSAAGVLAVVSSESVGNPYPGIVPYTVSKAALEEMVRGWRIEHPELRFTCIRVGTTPDTEFARDFDLGVTAELLPTWIALGRMPAQYMNAAELGAGIADALTVAVRTPSIDVHDLVIRAPGGVYVGGAELFLEMAANTVAGATD